MSLGDWISTASNLASGNLLEGALSSNSPVRKLGGKLVDQLIHKMSSKSGSFNKVFNKAQEKLATHSENAHFVRQLPAVKPGAYGPMAAGMLPNATSPTEAWARLEQFDANHDAQLDSTELDNALTELSRQEAEQISNGSNPAEVHQTQALRKFASGLQHYQQTIASFDQHKGGISAEDLNQLATQADSQNKINPTD